MSEARLTRACSMALAIASAIALAGALAACGRDDLRDASTRDTPGGVGGAAIVAASDSTAVAVHPTVVDTARPAGGNWSQGLLETRLRSLGFPVQPDPLPVHAPGFAVAGTRYQIGQGSHIDAFVYADVVARGHDTDPMERATAAATDSAGAAARPLLVTEGNLAAVIVSPDPALRAKLRAALERKVNAAGG